MRKSLKLFSAFLCAVILTGTNHNFSLKSFSIFNLIYDHIKVHKSDVTYNSKIEDYMSISSFSDLVDDEVHNLAVGDYVKTSWGYESLTDDCEKLCYNYIKDNCQYVSNIQKYNLGYTIKSFVIKNYKVAVADIKKIIYAFKLDFPEVFWLNSTFTYTHSYDYMRGAYDTHINLYSVLSPEQLRLAKSELDSTVNKILSNMPKGLSDYQKELYIHDYIIDNCKYDNSKTKNNSSWMKFTVYGCLVKQLAVCEGYSKAMQLLLNRCGVECITAIGSRLVNMSNEGHMWNIVKIGGDWYHVDTTWDGTGDRVNRYNYFNITDFIVQKDHSVYSDKYLENKNSTDFKYNFTLPKCTSKKFNFFELNAIKIKVLDSRTDETIINKLYNLAKTKDKYIYFLIETDKNYDNFINILFLSKPYKFFEYIIECNRLLFNYDYKISTKNVSFGKAKYQNAFTVKLDYN